MKNTFRGIGMTSQRTRERLIQRLRSEGIKDERVLEAVREVPRHIFVDEALASRAYEDTALPIGHGQTISQPYIVARMTEALISGGRLDTVLEIGTGCGYQTAILSKFAGRVFSIERIGALVSQARERLFALKVGNVTLSHGDGLLGWAEHAPFDGILAAAAPAGVPDALIGQLVVGGRLIIPVGPRGTQRLLQCTRTAEGVEEELLDLVSFVPMLGGAG